MPAHRLKLRYGLLGCAFLFTLAVLCIIARPSARARIYHPPDDRITIPTDAASIARGKHLVEAVAVCTICHGDNLGGKLAFEDRFLGRGYTANLTRGRGGIGARYTAADWVRSIRFGVRPDGRGIIFMPTNYYNAMSDADLGAVIAYLQNVPPVDNERTRVELNPIARLLIDLGLFGEVIRAARIDLQSSRPTLSAGDGAYLVTLAGCTFCHGAHLRGGQGPEPGAPGGPDLTRTGALRSWTEADFAMTLRTGLTASGHPINPKYMPWLGYRHMSDTEIALVWQYLQTL